jgi:uncharacterized membrane protein YccC
MVGAYSFIRTNYIVAIILMTPYVIIMFKFLGVGHVGIAEERIIDTFVGSVIAFSANYLVFPSWESEQLKQSLYEVLEANAGYLIKIADNISGITVDLTEYKLARKEVYIKSANLSAMFERMASEPKNKQHRSKEVHRFVVLNHILSSYIATLASSVSGKDMHRSRHENLKLVRRSINSLNDAARKLGGTPPELTPDKPVMEGAEAVELTADQKLLNEQLGFIHKITTDIYKLVDRFL